MLTSASVLTWCITALATLGTILRPWHVPEAVWAVAGAVALVVLGLLPWTDAVNGMQKGIDVYLFLIGMMLVAELARREGLFDWLAALAVQHARGSPQRLFLLIYLAGTVVTVLLSNDATAIVLTPAVYAATRAAGPARCLTSLSAPLSPTLRALSCRSRIRPISWCSASGCLIWPNGCGNSRCLRLCRLWSPISPFA